MMDSIFDDIVKDVEIGMEGKAISVPTGLEKYSKYASIKEKMFTLLFSSTGAGKSGFADTCYILNPYEWLFSRENIHGIEMDTILFSMERAKKYRVSKWIIRKIHKEHNVIIPIPKLYGWWKDTVSPYEKELIDKQRPYISKLMNHIHIYEGPKTPQEIDRILENYFSANGIYTKNEKGELVYLSNNPKRIVNIVLDHGNLTKKGAADMNKKAAIDNLCMILQGYRDRESAHIVWIAQVNRDASNPFRQKEPDMQLTLDDVKASGDIGDACDIGVSLFDPLKYKQGSKTGYNPAEFVSEFDGSKFFRQITICKSSYGADEVTIPLGFNGFCGDFAELPSRKGLTDAELQKTVENVKSGFYFLKKFK